MKMGYISKRTDIFLNYNIIILLMKIYKGGSIMKKIIISIFTAMIILLIFSSFVYGIMAGSVKKETKSILDDLEKQEISYETVNIGEKS